MKQIEMYPQSKEEVDISRERLMYIYSEADQLDLAEAQVRELLKYATGSRAERFTLGLATILYNKKERMAALDVLMAALEKPLVGGADIEQSLKKLASQILLTSFVGEKQDKKTPTDLKNMFDGVKLVNDLLVKYGGANLDGPFLYQAGMVCSDLRDSGVDLAGFDSRACEERIWRTLWQRKNDPLWSCRGGLELAKRLVVAGEFYGNEDKYNALLHELGIEPYTLWHTRFIPDEQVRTYFSLADLIVQPYKSATQSGVTQIAYHFSKPMLVTRVGGLPEIVPDGKVGYVTEVSAQAITDALIDFTKSAPERFDKGLAEEKAKYGWDKMTAAIMNEKTA